MIKLIAVTLGIATLATMAGYASGKVLSVPVQPVSIASMDKETFDITSTTTPADNGKEKKSELIIDVTDAVDRTFVYDGEKHSFKIPKITIAGVNTDEICPETMESKIVPGVYFAGELIDIDGMCGGYNLQWAWSSGYVAGKSAAKDD